MVCQVNQEKNYKNPGIWTTIGGIAAGTATEIGCVAIQKPIAGSIMKNMVQLSNTLNKDEFTAVDKALEKTITQSGLKDKGVEIIKATADNKKKIEDILLNVFKNNFFTRLFPEKQRKNAAKEIFDIVHKGKNAFYEPVSKKVVVPETKLKLAIFHELGHAMNANLSTVGKLLPKSRLAVVLTAPVSLIALLKHKKASNEKPKSGFDKTTTFIKNNAGLLTFASFIPMLTDEGLASFKGNKFAKELLNPDLARKVSKTNIMGFSTYLLMAVLCGTGVHLGVKLKDYIVSRKINNQNKETVNN